MVHNHKRRTDPKEFASIVEKGPTTWRLRQRDWAVTWVVWFQGCSTTQHKDTTPITSFHQDASGSLLLLYGFRCINQERPDFATVTSNPKLSNVVTQIYFSIISIWQLQFGLGLYSMSLHSGTEADRTTTTGILLRKSILKSLILMTIELILHWLDPLI